MAIVGGAAIPWIVGEIGRLLLSLHSVFRHQRIETKQ